MNALRSIMHDTWCDVVMICNPLLVNDTDVDLDILSSIQPVNGASAKGTVQLVGGNVMYTADSSFQALGAGQTRTDNFNYIISDGKGRTSTSTEFYTLLNVNQNASNMLLVPR